nr:LysR family transcriptional regulator substrate-binding protein [Lactobacillus delbrueckii]
MPEMIKAFHREYPNCKIFLEGFDHNRLKHHLIDHDSDVIFTTHDDITDLAEVKYYDLFSGHFVAIVPADHHLSDREELELDDLAGKKILLMDNNWSSKRRSERRSMTWTSDTLTMLRSSA